MRWRTVLIVLCLVCCTAWAVIETSLRRAVERRRMQAHEFDRGDWRLSVVDGSLRTQADATPGVYCHSVGVRYTVPKGTAATLTLIVHRVDLAVLQELKPVAIRQVGPGSGAVTLTADLPYRIAAEYEWRVMLRENGNMNSRLVTASHP